MKAVSKEVYELIREAYRSGYDNGYGNGWLIGKKYSRESEKIHPVTAADRYMVWGYVLDTEQDTNTIVNK